jgi:hypothetical protein
MTRLTTIVMKEKALGKGKQYRELVVISELVRQQRALDTGKSRLIKERIVSISKLHVQPIVRGKARGCTSLGRSCR